MAAPAGATGGSAGTSGAATGATGAVAGSIPPTASTGAKQCRGGNRQATGKRLPDADYVR